MSVRDYVFHTDRLIVRRWRPADQPAILTLYSDPQVVRWVDDGEPLSPNDAERWMAVTRANYARRGYGMFAIEASPSGEVIGFGGLVHPDGQPEPEVKYAFHPDVWGQGLATEFVRGLLEYGRAAHDLQEVVATVAAENTASVRVLLKAGLAFSTRRVEDDGSWTDVYRRPASDEAVVGTA